MEKNNENKLIDMYIGESPKSDESIIENTNNDKENESLELEAEIENEIENNDDFESLLDVGFSSLKKEEKEVVLTIDEKDKTWQAYVSSPYWMRRFERANWKIKSVSYSHDGLIVSKTYIAPPKCVLIVKERQKRILTDDELAELRNRAKHMQEARNKNK